MSPVSSPSISAVVTCHNQEAFIADAIESVLAQTKREAICEVVVVDDGSVGVIAELAQRHAMVVPVFLTNGGVSVARNAGVDATVGSYVAFLDGDDTWLPTKLETHPQCGGCTEHAPFQHDDSRVLRTLFMQGASIVPSTAVVRRNVFETCGGFDPALRQTRIPICGSVSLRAFLFTTCRAS